jgi:hypothetical protein
MRSRNCKTSGALQILSGRDCRLHPGRHWWRSTLRLRNGESRQVSARGTSINCTGPGGDFGRIGHSADRRPARAKAGGAGWPIGVGAWRHAIAPSIDGSGRRLRPGCSRSGPLTRPAWWEITAVPEINLQIERLVAQLGSPDAAHRLTASPISWTWGLAFERASRVGRKSRHGLEIAEIPVVADVHPARIAERLKVPRRVPSGAQRGVDEVAALLAREHRLFQGVEVPAPRDLAAGTRAPAPAWAWRGGEIAHLIGILPRDRRVDRDRRACG